MPQALKDLIEAFKPYFTRVVTALAILFERYPFRVGVALTLVVLSLVTGVFYVGRANRYQDIVSTTVRAEMEDTPQKFKVLEAFVLSAVDPHLADAIKKEPLSAEFTAKLDRMDQVLSTTPTPPPSLDVFISVPDGVGRDWKLQSQNALLTDTYDPGYLFFPVKLLRTTVEPTYATIFDESSRGPSKTLENAVRGDPVIVDDIVMSRLLAPIMEEFTRTNLFDANSAIAVRGIEAQPAQVYYITKNGLNRIVNYSGMGQRIIYRNLFRATTFFPSRPYFVEAFRLGDPGTLKNLAGRISDHFYVSQPYLDIGGFGVVITLARAIRYGSHSDAAICFDIRVPMNNPVSFQLREKLASFDATSVEVSCDIGGRIECPPKTHANDPRIYRYRTLLENRLSEYRRRGDLSAVVGDINILARPQEASDTQRAGLLDFLVYPVKMIVGYGTEPISFSLPLTSPSVGQGNVIKADFMITALDLGRFVQVTSGLGLLSAALFMTAFFLVILAWQQELQSRKGWQGAFEVVDKVMYGATTAYCRLDAGDEIIDCNTAFCGLLKRSEDQKTVDFIKGQSFESLVAPRSKATYQAVQERRRKGLDVQPYTLYFVCSDQSEVEARVTSGTTPGGASGSLPETFGIVIPS